MYQHMYPTAYVFTQSFPDSQESSAVLWIPFSHTFPINNTENMTENILKIWLILVFKMFKIFSLVDFFLRSNDLIEPLINTTRLQCPPMTSFRGTISHSLALNNFETQTKVAFVKHWPFWPWCVMLTLRSIQCKYFSFFLCVAHSC